MRRIFDCVFCSIVWLDLLAQPQISMPYVQIGFVIVSKYMSGTLTERRIYQFLEQGTHIALAFKPHMHAAESTENSCNCENKIKYIFFSFFFIRPVLSILWDTASHDASFATILSLYSDTSANEDNSFRNHIP